MDNAVLDALVTGYEGMIEALNLPDPNDRHVLAAAIIARSSCIVTFNTSDFPQSALEPFGLHAVHPDNFIIDVESLSPTEFARAVSEDFAHYKTPTLSVEGYVESMKRAGIPKTADKIAGLSVLLKAAAADDIDLSLSSNRHTSSP